MTLSCTWPVPVAKVTQSAQGVPWSWYSSLHDLSEAISTEPRSSVGAVIAVASSGDVSSIFGGGAVLGSTTSILIGAEVAVSPSLSVAVAVRIWAPPGALVQLKE